MADPGPVAKGGMELVPIFPICHSRAEFLAFDAGHMMQVFDIEVDARRAMDAMLAGGIAIVPTDVGYVILGATAGAVERIVDVKRRAPAKLNAMIGCRELHMALHELDEGARKAIETITEGYDLPVGAVAPARLDHPMLSGLEPEILARSTMNGTIAMLMNAGKLLDAMARISLEAAVPVIGSSANLTLHGTKFRIEDIEAEIVAAADMVIDYGLMRWSAYRKSSTMINFGDYSVVRHGSCFDLIADVMRRHFDIALAPE
jgi:tRNA A37 threonylcarbamoyladenosine synthetase subunit TsaC/SUA5/YrdC